MTNLEFYEQLEEQIHEIWSQIEVPDAQGQLKISDDGDNLQQLFYGKKYSEVDCDSLSFCNSHAIGYLSAPFQTYYFGAYALMYCEYGRNACIVDDEGYEEYDEGYGLSDAELCHQVMFSTLGKIWNQELPKAMRGFLESMAKCILTNGFNGTEQAMRDVSRIVPNF